MKLKTFDIRSYLQIAKMLFMTETVVDYRKCVDFHFNPISDRYLYTYRKVYPIISSRDLTVIHTLH